MRRIEIVTAMVWALVLTWGMALPAAQDPPTVMKVTLNISGSPLSGMELVLQLAEKGKVSAGTTNGNGQLNLNLTHMPKVLVEVSEEECPAPEGTHVLITQPGAKPDDRCTRRAIGSWMWGNGTNLVVDTGTGALRVVGGE